MRPLTLAECRAHAVQITAVALTTVAALTVVVCGSVDGTGLRTEGNADHSRGTQTVTVDPVRASLVADTTQPMGR
ncbi:hypothetical protein ACH4U7_26250 [Streptomyces sp. NPDC020845]|uniref:hypothetical protein n=1 Tax=Streptomyces sp. NPDC020845 TaxID=3365096 RepID=UPI0037AB5B6A